MRDPLRYGFPPRLHWAGITHGDFVVGLARSVLAHRGRSLPSRVG